MAKQQGWMLSYTMPDADVWNFFGPWIFHCGSGDRRIRPRLGMDVVKRNITAMGGTVDIRSIPGSGTTMAISLPLTLAILDGMSVKVGEEVYILPLGYVI